MQSVYIHVFVIVICHRELAYLSNLCMINIGARIKEELQKQERGVTWFAKKLNCNRSGVYRIFQRYSIDMKLLAQISEILEHNFFDELSEDINDGEK